MSYDEIEESFALSDMFIDDVDITHENVIEGELDNDVSFLYIKEEDKFYVNWWDSVEEDFLEKEITEDSFPLKLNDIVISKIEFFNFAEICRT